MDSIRFLNHPTPQVITSAAASDPVGWESIFVQVTEDCFVCLSAEGLGTDAANPPAAGNGHFMSGGSALMFDGIDPDHKLAISAGSAYISAVST